MNKLERLKGIILKYSYERREVTLASGRKSNFYFDGKQSSLHPEGGVLIGELMFEDIFSKFPQAQGVGGPTLGADPIVASIAQVSFRRGFPLNPFIVRKTPKGHGTKNWLEGAKHLFPGMRVVLVEDVITTGGSLLKAAQHVRDFGLVPVGVTVIVDREEGGRENIEADGLAVSSLFTKSDLIND